MPRALTEDEFNAVKARVLQNAPANLSEADFSRWAGPAMAQALGEAENQPAAPTSALGGSAPGRFASNLVNQAVVAPVKGLWNAAPIPQALGGSGILEGPVSAAKGLWAAHVREYEKAKELAAAGRYTEAAGHAAATLLPMLGPAAAGAGEQIASGDVAGGLGAGAGLLAPFAVKYGLELKHAPNPERADLLRREAEQQVSQRVLAPANPKYKVEAQRIAPEMLQRNMQGNSIIPKVGRLELQQAADEGMATAGNAIDAAVDAHAQQQLAAFTASGGNVTRMGRAAAKTIEDQGGQIPIRPMLEPLDKKIASLMPNGEAIPTAAGRVGQLIRLRDYLSSLGPTASFEKLQSIRDDFYRAADAAKGYQGPDVNVPDVGWAAREAGSAIRETFASRVPGLSSANADYTFFKRLGDVLDPTLGRPKAVNAVTSGATGGLHTTGAIVGAATKIPGASLVLSRVLPAIQEIRYSPAWQLASAAKKARLADAIERGDMGGALSLLSDITRAAPRQTEDQTP